MESVRKDVGEACGTAQEGLKDVLTVDTAKVRSHLDEVVRSTLGFLTLLIRPYLSIDLSRPKSARWVEWPVLGQSS